MIKQITDNDKAWDDELKGRNRNFVVYYCTDPDCFMNGRKAYIKAFTKYKAGKVDYVPKDSVADAAASRLLSNVKVKQSCRTLLRMLQPDVDTDNATKLLHDLALQALYNPKDIIDSNGQLIKPLEELGDLAKCVEQIYPTQFGFRVRLCDRSKAQRNLLEYFNLVRELPTHDISLPVVYINTKAETIEDWNKQNDSSAE